MPSQKPRIALTVSDDLNGLLDRLSDLTGTPKSKLIVEMLDQYAPVLKQVLEALEEIKSNKENAPAIAKKFAHDMILDSQELLGIVAKEAKSLQNADD